MRLIVTEAFGRRIGQNLRLGRALLQPHSILRGTTTVVDLDFGTRGRRQVPL